jgi:hypothetical protein
MGELQLTRRAALAAMTLAAASAAVRASAAPLGDVRFREIRVDVSPLKDKYEDDAARWVAAVLPGYLKQTFAKYLAPGDRSAGILVARIDDVVIGVPGSRMSIGFLSNDTTDGIEGAGVVLDGRGHAVGSYPLYSSLGADSLQNSPYQTDILRRRVETLALSFAQWLPGKMGL